MFGCIANSRESSGLWLQCACPEREEGPYGKQRAAIEKKLYSANFVSKFQKRFIARPFIFVFSFPPIYLVGWLLSSGA